MNTENENKLNDLNISDQNEFSSSIDNNISKESIEVQSNKIDNNINENEALPQNVEDTTSLEEEGFIETDTAVLVEEDFEAVIPNFEDNDQNQDVISAEDNSDTESSEEISNLSNEEILERLRYLIHETNVEDTKKEIESLSSQYYKNKNIEHDKFLQTYKEKTGSEVEIEVAKDPSEDYLKELMSDFKRKKSELAVKQQEEKIQNLKLKEEIIEKIKNLVNSEDAFSKTFSDFKSLQQEWLNIGAVPNNEANNLWKNYQLQIERFYEFVKINKELRDLDLKRNLEQKISICEKVEELLLETDIIAAYKRLQEFHNAWKEIGTVPNDKREEIWDRFSETSKKIRHQYQEHYKKIREEQKANYEQKLILCQKAEAILADKSPETSKEWIELTDQIIELQNIWKTIGASEHSNEIFTRFRGTCNSFFDAKKEFFSDINEELKANLQAKIELCINAEANKDNTDWKKTTELFIGLQKKWKTIGPAPKKHSDQVWQRFKTACNYFFEAKSNFYSNIESEHKENLSQKESLISEIKNFQPTEDQADNIAKIKAFQTRWTDIGFVPSSQKDKLYMEYRNAINAIFENLNLNKHTIEINNYNAKLEVIKSEDPTNRSLSKEKNRIVQKIQELNTEILQIENNMSFFSSGSENIIKEFNKKIDKIKEEIQILKEKKKAIDLAERESKKQQLKDE